MSRRTRKGREQNNNGYEMAKKLVRSGMTVEDAVIKAGITASAYYFRYRKDESPVRSSIHTTTTSYKSDENSGISITSSDISKLVKLMKAFEGSSFKLEVID